MSMDDVFLKLASESRKNRLKKMIMKQFISLLKKEFHHDLLYKTDEPCSILLDYAYNSNHILFGFAH